MSIRTDTENIKKLFEDSPIFKAATPEQRANRPKPREFKIGDRVTSLTDLTSLTDVINKVIIRRGDTGVIDSFYHNYFLMVRWDSGKTVPVEEDSVKLI